MKCGTLVRQCGNVPVSVNTRPGQRNTTIVITVRHDTGTLLIENTRIAQQRVCLRLLGEFVVLSS